MIYLLNMVISIATLAYQMLFFRGGSTNDQVQHLHADRLGVNFFFEPRFGSMQWPNSSGNFYAETAKERKEHLAMRSLWFQSANEVWNKFGKGVPFHGWKMEIL